MSFAGQVKRELMHLQPEKSCCQLSELSALTQCRASLVLRGGGRMSVVYQVENVALAKRIFLLLKLRLNIVPAIEYAHSPRLGGRRICVLTVPESESRKLLVNVRMLRQSESGDVLRTLPRSAISKRCCRNAYLRGAFLGAGSLLSPEKGYHMEFVASSKERADALKYILDKSGVTVSETQRRGSTVLYFKKGDDLVSLLAMMGAGQSLMDMENARIRRESRNQANRAANCDQANTMKQITAAQNQADRIRAYLKRNGDNPLGEDLRVLARLRLEHVEASLEQLGEMPELNLTKSGVNYRMRKLMKIIEADEKQMMEESP
ncbi:MAG: DNA-binding protein WhiA [Clostridiales bacterium]|nr:DNA-binding protein WhiA [Clostridiales bacterium]